MQFADSATNVDPRDDHGSGMVERQNALAPLLPRRAVHAVLTPLAMRARYGVKCSLPGIFSAPQLLNLR
jgi:hypothetical protein